ncbi:MAG: hypothetical protein FJW90_00775 [Actinobacteria bacterium]|nr:hypothetical protein [Actinomycetota bacterium]
MRHRFLGKAPGNCLAPPLSAGNPVDGDEDPEAPDPPANVSIPVDGGQGSIDVTYKADKSLDFTASAGYVVVDVFVKGGTGTNWYAYNPGVSSDTGLFAPLNNGGQRAGVSHAVFCWLPAVQVSEWCSPGFWKNNADKHGASAWPVPTNTKYESVIGTPAPAGGILGPNPINGHDPTLLQVLKSPKTCFGATNQGAAFNAVGTYLSIEAGLTNVVEGTDNCPINQHGERVWRHRFNAVRRPRRPEDPVGPTAARRSRRATRSRLRRELRDRHDRRTFNDGRISQASLRARRPRRRRGRLRGSIDGRPPGQGLAGDRRLGFGCRHAAEHGHGQPLRPLQALQEHQVQEAPLPRGEAEDALQAGPPQYALRAQEAQAATRLDLLDAEPPGQRGLLAEAPAVRFPPRLGPARRRRQHRLAVALGCA